MANEKISKDSIVKALRKENNAVWDQIIENLRFIDKGGVGAPASSDKMKARMKKSEGLSARVKLLEAAIDKYKNGPKYPRKIPSNILKILGKTPPSKTKPLPKSKGGEMEAAAAAKAAAAKRRKNRDEEATIDKKSIERGKRLLKKVALEEEKEVTEAVKAAEGVRAMHSYKYGHLRPENKKTMEQKNWKDFEPKRDEIAATAAAKKRERDHKEQKRIAFREDTFGDPEAESTLADRNWKGFKEEKDAYSEYDKYSGGGMVKTYARGGSPRKVRY